MKNIQGGGELLPASNGMMFLTFLCVCLLLFISYSSVASSNSSLKIPVESFKLDGEPPVNEQLVNELLAPYINTEQTVESLLEIAAKLERLIHDHGYTFYRVILPQQTMGEDQQVVLQVEKFTLDEVTIEGNEYFDTANIRRSLPALVEGESVNTEVLSQNLKVATYHPLKDLTVTFRQSTEESTVDADIEVVDADPQNFALILANTGSDATGNYRLTGSYQHTNLWNKDHIFNLSYTTSPGHYDDVKQYGFSYSAPIYSQSAWLTGYAVKSDVDTGTVGAFDISGAGKMMGLHYLKNLRRLDRYEHWLDVGIDNRLFQNNILFGNISLLPDVRSVPVSVQYKGELPWKNNQVNFSLQASANTGIGGHNNDASYNGNRTNADDRWQIYRYGVSIRRVHQDWNLAGSVVGQYTSEPLISGEQFGLGGAASVRGYDEREIGKDVGFMVKLEATSPKVKQVRFAGFADFGAGFNQDVQPGDPPKTQRIASYGVGVRWQYEKLLLAVIDFAHALKDGAAGGTQAGDNKIHAMIMMNF